MTAALLITIALLTLATAFQYAAKRFYRWAHKKAAEGNVTLAKANKVLMAENALLTAALEAANDAAPISRYLRCGDVLDAEVLED